MLITSIPLILKPVDRCLFLKIFVVIVIIITNIYGSIQSPSLYLCLFCGYYGGLTVLFGKSPKGDKKRV
jgi:hypothetical protein